MEARLLSKALMMTIIEIVHPKERLSAVRYGMPLRIRGGTAPPLPRPD